MHPRPHSRHSTRTTIARYAWPFLAPVKASEAPDYYEVISNPMDLSTVMARLDSEMYQVSDPILGMTRHAIDDVRFWLRFKHLARQPKLVPVQHHKITVALEESDSMTPWSSEGSIHYAAGAPLVHRSWEVRSIALHAQLADHELLEQAAAALHSQDSDYCMHLVGSILLPGTRGRAVRHQPDLVQCHSIQQQGGRRVQDG